MAFVANESRLAPCINLSEFVDSVVDHPPIDYSQLVPAIRNGIADRCIPIFCKCHDTSLEDVKYIIELFTDQPESVESRYKKYIHMLTTLLQHAKDNVTEDTDDLQVHMEQAIHSCKSMYNTLTHMLYQRAVTSRQMSGTVVVPKFSTSSQTMPFEDYKPVQKFILYLLEQCRLRHLRKNDEGDMIFAPKYVDGNFVHYFEPKYEVDRFVHLCLYSSNNQVLWYWATCGANNTTAAAKYLSNCIDDSLPIIQRQRTLFAFQNGVFDASIPQFFVTAGSDSDWPHKTSNIDPTHVAVNYIQLTPDPGNMDFVDDPMKIPTPHFDSILVSQKFNDEVKLWMYAMLGRLVFPAGELDNWQVMAFFKGRANTGKSTIIDIVSNFWSKLDVGTLNTETGKTFTLEHLYKSLVFFARDVDEKLSLSQTRWNSMVSNESIAVERKFKTALEVKWNVPGAMAGNVDLPYADRSGSMSRRLLIFLFSERVQKTDTRLVEKCKDQLGALLIKCVLSYLLVVKKFGNVGIWTPGVLPKFFHSNKEQLMMRSDPVAAFVKESNMVTIREGATVNERNLAAAYGQFVEERGFTTEKGVSLLNFYIKLQTHVECERDKDTGIITGIELKI